MIRYPQHYSVQARSPSGIGSGWASGSKEVSLQCAIPPEFEGPGGGASPEDLYALALTNCFVATFKVFAEKSRLEFREIEASGVLTVDRDEKGVPWMARFDLSVMLYLPGYEPGHSSSDEQRALTLLEKTSRSCMILNSVKTEKTFKFGVKS